MNDGTFFALLNLDLFSAGIAVAGMVILGFAVFFSDTQSLSNRIFLFLTLVTSIWGAVNYFSYQPNVPGISFWLLRATIFFGVLSAFFTFMFAYIFPARKKTLSPWVQWGIGPLTAITALATLTPIVFQGIAETAPDGHITAVHVAPGLFLFIFTVLILNIGAIALFLKKLTAAEAGTKAPFRMILLGMFIMLGLIVTFNLVLPAVFKITRFIPLGALFLFPFIALTAYAVLRHKIFNIKVTSTAILVFALSIVTFGEIIFADETSLVIYRMSIFVLVLLIGTSLIRGVVREVRQREEIEQLAERLQTANEKLKELDKLKSQFLSIASHDLRAPLTAVRNFMSLLMEGTYGRLPVAAEEGMRQVFERATEMAKSVDTYLNVSRIEQGRMKYDFAEHDLVKIVSDTVTIFKSIAEKKGLTFSFRGPMDLKPILIKADLGKLQEVFNNLIDNSIKYTPKGSVTISLEKKEKMARITIADTGVGMSPETIKKLFGLFSTGEDSRKINISSTGIGLYISKAHVEAHKGRVWAESDGEGKGSRFIIELPLLKVN